MARAWVVALAALIGVAITARLGWWQLDRAALKLNLQSQLDARRQQPSLHGSELARSADEAASQHFRRVVVRGRWQARHTVFLDNRQMGGRPGFFVVTPLELAPGEAVLVQRGWAPRDLRDRTALPTVPTPEGPITVSGWVAPPPGRLLDLGEPGQGRLRQNLDLEAFGRETSLQLLPMSILQDAPSATDGDKSRSDDGLRREWPAPAVDVHKHHGYAFQWFGLSSLLTGLYVWFQVLQPWLRRRSRAR